MTPLRFELDGQARSALPGQSLLDVALAAGIRLPHLCTQPGLAAGGNCRSCLVEVCDADDDHATLAAACCSRPAAGQVVRTDSERARQARRLVLELLQSDVPENVYSTTMYKPGDELTQACRDHGVAATRFPPRPGLPADASHPSIAVHRDACIQCARCVRACASAQPRPVIGLAFSGRHTRVVFDLDTPLGASSCVGCGLCAQACPTGALMLAA